MRAKKTPEQREAERLAAFREQRLQREGQALEIEKRSRKSDRPIDFGAIKTERLIGASKHDQ